MIIDYKADSKFAQLFHPVDAETGEPIDFPIWYADDVEGVIRYYKRSGPNIFVRDPETDGPISIEETRRIRLVPTDGNQYGRDLRREIQRESKSSAGLLERFWRWASQ